MEAKKEFLKEDAMVPNADCCLDQYPMYLISGQESLFPMMKLFVVIIG